MLLDLLLKVIFKIEFTRTLNNWENYDNDPIWKKKNLNKVLTLHEKFETQITFTIKRGYKPSKFDNKTLA